MNIHVEIRGTIRSYLSTDAELLHLEIPPGTKVGEVVTELGIPIERGWNASLKGRLVSDKDILCEGDHLMIFDVIGGG